MVAKTDTIYKRAYNEAIDSIAGLEVGAELPSENRLCAQIGVSRTTIRKILQTLDERGVIGWDGSRRRLFVIPEKAERYPAVETVPPAQQVEARFMQWMLRDDTRPGTAINELDLARRFGVATTTIREFLNRFQRHGLIERRPGAGWVFKGFTPNFALELFEIREMFELRSARVFAGLPETAPAWKQLTALRTEHVALLEVIDERFRDFSRLDSRFHRLITSVSPNRFIDSFQDIMALIFHYHYQWNKRDERQRNEAAIREHLTYIDALLTRNVSLIELACSAHLASARETLLRSIVH